LRACRNLHPYRLRNAQHTTLGNGLFEAPFTSEGCARALGAILVELPGSFYVADCNDEEGIALAPRDAAGKRSHIQSQQLSPTAAARC
jgi:hypothetical protein